MRWRPRQPRSGPRDALDRAVDETVQIAGGRGYVKGYPYERMYRDARITRIFEGTNEVLRLFVGLSGVEGPGEFLQEIGAALRAPIQQLGTLAEFAGERVRLALHRGEPAIDIAPHPQLRRHFRYLEEHTRDLRTATERSIRRFGRELIERQLVVARLADMATELYVRAAMLSRTQAILEAWDRGESATPPDTDADPAGPLVGRSHPPALRSGGTALRTALPRRARIHSRRAGRACDRGGRRCDRGRGSSLWPDRSSIMIPPVPWGGEHRNEPPRPRRKPRGEKRIGE